MAYDPKKDHRRSIRMPQYDYSEPGAYFLTICTRLHRELFGRVAEGRMRLNDAGRMVEHWWRELPMKFPLVALDEHVVMPNHTHAIVALGMYRADDGWRFAPAWEEEWIPLGTIVQWLKTQTTNAYIRGVKEAGWPRFDRKLWHRNYWEHVVRDDEALERIRDYIRTNPERWGLDRENLRRKGDDAFDRWMDSFRKPKTEESQEPGGEV